jgi:hypothetical protein
MGENDLEDSTSLKSPQLPEGRELAIGRDRVLPQLMA